jgi:ABC-type transporter Mla subunit MlaD
MGPLPPNKLAKVVLGILGVWGLLAGFMLIHTLLATKQLHKRVTSITASVSAIDKDTGSVALMQETNRLSGELLAASQPLPGTLAALRSVTAGLATKVDSILGGSTTIERHSKEIEGKVVSARDTAAAIGDSVGSIGSSLSSILATLRETRSAAGEINGSTKGINSAVAALLPVVRNIDAGIGKANQGIAEAATYVDAIRADVGNILAGLPDVLKHARSIDCSGGLALLGVVTGPGEACGP